MRTVCLMIAAVMALAGCPRKDDKSADTPVAAPTPTEKAGATATPHGSGSAEKAAPKTPPASDPTAGPSTGKQPTLNQPPEPIAPHAPGVLAAADAKTVIDKIKAAHYDAAALGLESVDFAFKLRLKVDTTIVYGTGTWRKEGAPDVQITRIQRKDEDVPEADDVGKQVWTSLRFRVRNLIGVGLGRGYLHGRFAGWAKQKGTVKGKEKDRLVVELKSDGDEGDTTLVLDDGYRVSVATNRSPKGATREMRYTHQMVDGRNLVTATTFSVVFDKDTKVPQKSRILLEASDKMTLAITYEKVGRYHLPVRLHQTRPRIKQESHLELRYP